MPIHKPPPKLYYNTVCIVKFECCGLCGCGMHPSTSKFLTFSINISILVHLITVGLRLSIYPTTRLKSCVTNFTVLLPISTMMAHTTSYVLSWPKSNFGDYLTFESFSISIFWTFWLTLVWHINSMWYLQLRYILKYAYLGLRYHSKFGKLLDWNQSRTQSRNFLHNIISTML